MIISFAKSPISQYGKKTGEDTRLFTTAKKTIINISITKVSRSIHSWNVCCKETNVKAIFLFRKKRTIACMDYTNIPAKIQIIIFIIASTIH